MAERTVTAGTSMSLERRLLVAVGVWAGATVLLSALLQASYLGADKSLRYTVWVTAVRCALWGLALPPLLRVVRRVPLYEGAWPRQAGKLLLIALVVSPVIGIVHMALVYWTYFPYRGEVAGLWAIIGNGWINFTSEVLIGVGVLAALQAWDVLDRYRAARTRAAQLEQQLTTARQDAMRMQLQPHFLFNTLHTIAGLIGEEPASARRMVIELGDLLRLTLRDGPRGIRSLAEELAFIDLYMDIVKFRLGDRLALDYDLDPDARLAEVPSLLLQPLFENAVRHGASRVTGVCAIAFRAWHSNGRLHVTLENDGPIKPAMAAAAAVAADAGSGASAASVASASVRPPTAITGNWHDGGLGLANTQARLRLQYGDEFTFQYADRPSGGARVELSWPYRLAASDTNVEEPHDDGAVQARVAH